MHRTKTIVLHPLLWVAERVHFGRTQAFLFEHGLLFGLWLVFEPFDFDSAFIELIKLWHELNAT